MRRIIFQTMLLIVLGAIVNVGVAWVLFINGSPGAWLSPPDPKEATNIWHRFRRFDVHNDGDEFIASAWQSTTETLVSVRPRAGGTLNQYDVVGEFQIGSPTRSLCGQWWGIDESRHGLLNLDRIGIQQRVSQSIGLPYYLPIRPLWPGFAINTIFYAAILWILFAAPFAARRTIRRRRGRCITCNYDLRARPADSSACPECGTPVK